VSQTAALILSIAVEAVVAHAAMRLSRWGGGGRAAFAATIATLITHPIVWRTVPSLEPAIGYGFAVVLIEIGVVLAESIAYRIIVPLAWPRALAISLFANAASTAAGLAYYALAL
jgi:hypothetical protein